MTALLDGRPSGLNAFFRPGDAFDFTLSWPAGALDGRTFTATLDDAELAVTADGDDLSISTSAAQTAAASEATFRLVETTGGTERAVLVGRWSASIDATTSHRAAVEVADGSHGVTVTVVESGTLGQIAAAHPPWVTVPSRWQQRVRATLAEAADRQVIVRAWGGSITAGYPGPTDPLTTSWVALVRQALVDRWGDGGSGYVPAILAGRTGTWTSAVGFAGSYLIAAGTATMTWTLTGTKVRIYHRNDTTGVHRYRIDGGSWTTVTPPTGFGGRYNAIEVTGLADTAHTVEVERVSGTIGIAGAEGTRATGIVFQRAAISGRAVSQYARQTIRRRVPITITNTQTSITGSFLPEDAGRYITAPGQTGFAPDVTIASVASSTAATLSIAATATGARSVNLGLIAPTEADVPLTDTAGNAFVPGLGTPDLTIVGTGVNDGGYTEADPASYLEGLGKVLRSARHALVLSEHHAAFADYGFAVGFRGLASGVARTQDAAFVDVWAKGRFDFTYWNELGYFADAVHPSDAGSVVYAADVIDLLT